MCVRLAAAVLALTLPAPGQFVQRWVHRYNGGDGHATAVAVDSSGNVVVTGESWGGATALYDRYTAKYAALDGALLWEKRYNGPGNRYDGSSAVAVDSSGNVVVAGDSVGAGDNFDFHTTKYAAGDGTLLWEKRYDGTQDDDRTSAMALDSDGNVVVTGFSRDQTGGQDYYTAKYAAADGALLWEKRYDGPGHSDDAARAVAVDGSGNVIVTGASNNGTDDDYYTAKYAALDGALLWEKRYNTHGFPASGLDRATAIAVDHGGNAVVTGYSPGVAGGLQIYTAKYAAGDGAVLWERRSSASADDSDLPHAVAVDRSGNVLVAGQSSRAGFSNDYYSDYYTAKYAASDGTLLWERRYDGPGNDDFAAAIVADGSGNAVVTGAATGSWTDYDYYTAKYAAADGALLWEKLYHAPGDRWYDHGRALGLTRDGGVVVTGGSFDASSDYANVTSDLATVYYAPGTARESWRQDHFGIIANTGVAADDADPDHDGLSNLVEWGCGLNPNVFSASPATRGEIPDFALIYFRSTVAMSAGATFALEWSDTLFPGDWHTDGVSETILSNSGILQQVKASIPAATAKRFARLRVTAPR